MSRYIDADVFMKNLKTDKHGNADVNKVEIAISKSLADVVEVVHAYDKSVYPSLFECSNCGWSCNDTYCGEPCNKNGNTYDYCPNCGARIEYKVKEKKNE